MHSSNTHKSFIRNFIPFKKQLKESPLEGGLREMALRALFLISLLVPSSLLLAQDYSTTIRKTAHFQNTNNTENELFVYNINGTVSVEGYDGDKIKVTAEEQISGSNNEVQRAKKELQFKVERSGNKVLVYLDAPFINLNNQNGHFNYNVHRNDENDSYNFLFNIRIQMPKNAAVHASTINKGKVSITNTKGKVFVSNINGDVKLDHISGKTYASTINGDISIQYDKSPNEDSDYHTINGKIEVYYPKNLSADIRFKSLHGDLYTDFENVHHLKAQVQTNKENDGKKTTYHVGRFTPVRIGKGGPTFNFKILNGDVYIKKN